MTRAGWLEAWLGLALASCGSAAATDSSSAPFPTASPTVPAAALAACYAHPAMIDPAGCVANTLPALQARLAEWPSSPPPGTQPPSRQAIERLARQAEGAPDGTPTRSERTTYGRAAARMGGDVNPVLGGDVPVWLVSMDFALDGSRAPDDHRPEPQVSTVIIDAANGAVIDACGGCNTVKS